ncbi:helix-turn-helix domain-containing protein [Sphingomonas yabuuchiae]|uniref:helix-turn-helix domain-containing protein n=1 Tax=Sphingomonas yabuuchiae TaxID=172044 RepID=UPI003D994C10
MEPDGGVQIVSLLYPGDFVGMPFANRSADTIAALSRGAMAEALELAVETVSRQMTAFRQDGLIALSGQRGVRLIDRTRLAVIAGQVRQRNGGTRRPPSIAARTARSTRGDG